MEEDPDYANWIKANSTLATHYRIDSAAAQTLHFVRATRLKMVRGFYEKTIFKYKDIGCGICRGYQEKSNIHQHMFNQCPVVKDICDAIGVPLPARMADWILIEAEHGVQHHIRDLAHAIWKFERKLRLTGQNGNHPDVQHEHLHLFDRAISGYALDMAKRNRTEV